MELKEEEEGSNEHSKKAIVRKQPSLGKRGRICGQYVALRPILVCAVTTLAEWLKIISLAKSASTLNRSL
jgi:hypothetical protein